MKKTTSYFIKKLFLKLLLMHMLLLTAKPLRASASNPASNRAYMALEGHVSALSDSVNRSLLSSTFGYGLRSGYRWERIGVFFHAEHNMWLAVEYEIEPVYGAINIGLGIEYIFSNGLIKSSLSMGPSILSRDTLLDSAGRTGAFLDLRPLGIRWQFLNNMAIGLDPITMAVVAPVLGDIPLIMVEYRTQLFLEVLF